MNVEQYVNYMYVKYLDKLLIMVTKEKEKNPEKIAFPWRFLSRTSTVSLVEGKDSVKNRQTTNKQTKHQSNRRKITLLFLTLDWLEKTQ